MFSSHDIRFPEEGWQFRAMKQGDIPAALDIIGLCDSDDREWAEETYLQRGLGGQFVSTKNKVVRGVTGFVPAFGTLGAVWLSWTYLHPENQGKGIGSAALVCLFDSLEKMNYRKIFVSMSDYCDEDGGELYSAAMNMYKGAGFNIELQHEDYYKPGETQIILGRQLNPKKPSMAPSPTSHHTLENISLLGTFPVDETEGVFAIDWEYVEGGGSLPASEIRDFAKQQAMEKGIRSLFISVADDHTFILRTIVDAGFKNVGRLRDFYQSGVNEVHFRMNF